MNSFTSSLTKCHPRDVIPMISESCARMDVVAYLYRALPTGAVFLYVSFDSKDLTIVSFGYKDLLKNKSTENHFIATKALETAELIRTADSTTGTFSSIDPVAAFPYTSVNDIIAPEQVIKIPYEYKLASNEAEEITSFLVSLFKAVPTQHAFSQFDSKIK